MRLFRLFRLFQYAILGLLCSSCSTNTGSARAEWSALSMSGGSRRDLIVSAGSVVGGRLISATLDEQDRRVMDRTSPRTVERMERGEPLTINDIIKLSQGGVNDSTILNYMSETDSNYTLSQAQIRRLQDAGVSQRVIDFMVDSGR